MQPPAIGHDDAKSPVTLREMRTYLNKGLKMFHSILQWGVATVLTFMFTPAVHAGFLWDDNYADCMSSSIKGASYRDPNLPYKQAAAKQKCFAKFCKGKSRQVHDAKCESETNAHNAALDKRHAELAAVKKAMNATSFLQPEWADLRDRRMELEMLADPSFSFCQVDKVVYEDKTCPAY
jgi:hypothetical protein